MKGYVGVCDCGYRGPRRADAFTARRDLGSHVCPPVCGLCGWYVPILVDGTDLCLACDSVAYPSVGVGRGGGVGPVTPPDRSPAQLVLPAGQGEDPFAGVGAG